MRKHMKLIVSAIAILCMMSMMLVPAFAAASDEGKLAVADGTAVENGGVYTLTFDAGTISWSGLGTTAKGEPDIQDKNGLKEIGLGPVDPEHVKDAYVEFAFEVATAGKYTLTIGYASKTDNVKNPNEGDEGKKQNRAANYSVNGGDVKALDVDQTASDWGKRLEVVIKDVELVAGKNTVRFTNPDNFDDNYIKSINVCDVAWALTAASQDPAGTDAPTTDAPTTDAPTTDAPTTDAPTTNAPTTGKAPTTGAPKTGFITVALAIAAVGSGAYVISKRNH